MKKPTMLDAKNQRWLHIESLPRKNEPGWSIYTRIVLSFIRMKQHICFLRSFSHRSPHRRLVPYSKLIYRSEFIRKPRVSLLCFIGINGMLNCYQTEGTFTRLKFVDFCRSFATDSDAKVQQYPEKYSVWIMDGAKIHLDKNFIVYLRSLGIIVVFLPAYSPFFNPIELVFGLMKRKLEANYIENSKIDTKMFIGEVVNHFSNQNFKNIFKKCGYLPPGRFDPSLAFDADLSELGYSQ